MNQQPEAPRPDALKKVQRSIGGYVNPLEAMVNAHYGFNDDYRINPHDRMGVEADRGFNYRQPPHPLARPLEMPVPELNSTPIKDPRNTNVLKLLQPLTTTPTPRSLPDRPIPIERSAEKTIKQLWFEEKIRGLLEQQMFGNPTGQEYHHAEMLLEGLSQPLSPTGKRYIDLMRNAYVTPQILQQIDHARVILRKNIYGPDTLLAEELLQEQETGVPVLQRVVVENFPYSNGALYAARNHKQTLIPFTQHVGGEASLSWELSSPSRIGRFIQRLR